MGLHRGVVRGRAWVQRGAMQRHSVGLCSGAAWGGVGVQRGDTQKQMLRQCSVWLCRDTV